MSVVTTRHTFTALINETATRLPGWTVHPYFLGDPHATFADQVGHDVQVHLEATDVAVTNWMPDGGQQLTILTEATPTALTEAIEHAAAAYDAIDPARAFLDRAVKAVGAPPTVTWESRTARVEWRTPAGALGALLINRLAVPDVRAMANLTFKGLSLAAAAPILATATDGQHPGDAEGAGEAAQLLVKAAPALWLNSVLENAETGAVERADLSADDVHVSITTRHRDQAVHVHIHLSTWLGLDRILTVLTTARA
ncbi:hypothetical protein [Streptomyces sp. NPDC085665]|uniref:hypothetical protein n=1 Tax=Streptomyces sp. NPDC085665 TaxID=3365735 RepID=UPI0037D0E5A7